MQLLIPGDALVDKDILVHWLEKTANTAIKLINNNLHLQTDMPFLTTISKVVKQYRKKQTLET